MQLRSYKKILKASYGDDIISVNFIQTVIDVLVDCSDQHKDYFMQLNVCDLINVLMELRANCMGNTASILIPKDNKHTEVELRLDWIQEDINKFSTFCEQQFIEFDEFKLFFGVPSLQKLMSGISTEEQFLCFLSRVEVTSEGNGIFEINNTEDAKRLLNNLSAMRGKAIIDRFQSIIEKIYEQNFLSRYKLETTEQMRFVPSISSILWYTKLMFNEPLESLYHNIFMLSKYGNMNPDYIEKCTPGEYIYFTKKLQESMQIENESNSSPEELNA